MIEAHKYALRAFGGAQHEAKVADPNRAGGGVAYPSEIIPEQRATSCWNAARDQIGMLDEIILDSRATSLGIHIQSHNSPKRRSNKPMLIGPGAIPVQSGTQGSVWR